MADQYTEQLPAVTGAGNLALFLPHPGGVEIHRVPSWVTALLGAPHDFPTVPGPGHALGPLANLARDLFESRLPLDQFLLELRGPSGATVSLGIQGRWFPDAGAMIPGFPRVEAVVLALRDVSDVIRQQRKAMAVGAYHGLVGQSLAMLEVFQRIALYGPTEAPVIVTGETGVGKELVAKALHDRSKRQPGPFVAVNCMALSPELFESELFGHEKGSFTGAMRSHRGRFQRADGGTLFLDEIGDMPLHTQAKMLRALEDGMVERVGSEEPERVDVRIVAATNVALEQSVQLRRFRADLFHRLSVLRIHVPPLRERHGDLPALVESFLDVFNQRYGKEIKRVTPEALRMMEDYAWPGNVRELRNVMERLVIETTGEAIGSRALLRWMDEREYFAPGGWNADVIPPPRAPIITEPAWSAPTDLEPPRAGDHFWGRRPHTLETFPRELPNAEIIEAPTLPPTTAPAPPPEITADSIAAAFATSRGNLTAAARHLGVHKATLYRHMKELGITREQLQESAGEPE